MTIVFVDLVGYTAMSSELDVEEVHLLVRPLMNGLRRVCEDLGGAVPSIEGDGFMAVFGATQSDPEDPSRAVVATAKMQRLIRDRRQAYGEVLRGLRVGVHVGEVLVAPSWEQHGFSVSGDVVNVASRLCTAAAPGEVLASSDLQALLPGGMWREPRALQLKNRAGSVTAATLAWTEMGEASPAVVRPVVASLRGRAPERAALDDALGGGAILVLGPSGVGKSRLVEDWTSTVTGRTVLRGYCSSFDVDSERSVAHDLLAGLPAELRTAAAARCDSDVARALAEPLESSTAREAVLAVAALLARAAEIQPLMVLLDDLQWASAGTAALTTALQDAGDALQLVLLSRTDIPWITPSTTIALAPLEEDVVRDLVAEMLPGAPSSVTELLVERSGGLPLFVEQCVELLLEDGTVALREGACELVSAAGLRRIPTAMRLFVGARLDMLTEPERRVVLTAAVLGDRVDSRLLHLLQPDAGAAVASIVQRGLMRWEDTAHDGELPLLRFSHALVREVAYASQLRTARRATHCAAADWYGILPAREMIEARAKHLRAAVDLGPADCTLALEAVLAMTAWAQGIVAERPAQAVDIVEEVLALDARLPECRLPLLEARLTAASGYELIGREADAARQARLAAPLASEAGDAATRGAAALLEGRSLVLSDPAAAEEKLHEAEGHFTEAGDRAGAARTAIERAIMLEASEGLGPVLRAHENAYRVGIQVGDKRLVSHAAQQLAFFTCTRSRLESELWVDRASAAGRSDDDTGRATVQLAVAFGRHTAYDLVGAAQAAEEARATARACGADFVFRNATLLGLEAHVLLGELDAGRALLNELVDLAGSRPNPLMRQNALLFGALLAAREGDSRRAEALLGEAEGQSISSEPNIRRGNEALRGQVLLDRGDWAGAERAAAAAANLDQLLEQPFLGHVQRLIRLRAVVAGRGRVSLREGLDLPRESEERGAPAVAALARLWLRLDDALRGEHETELSGALPALAEARALELEITALRDGQPDLLLASSAEWATLGATVWPARALAWHTELTGQPHPEVEGMLSRAGADPALASAFASQVSGR